jgi:hypothetical protein
MIWAGMTSEYLIGPYFLDGLVNVTSYSAMLQTWLIPQLTDRGLLDVVWLQHNGAPAHFALSVHDVLNEYFPGRWIVRGSPTSLAPLPWPPRIPDLITPDNSLFRCCSDSSLHNTPQQVPILHCTECCAVLSKIESEVRIVWVYGDFSPTLYMEQFILTSFDNIFSTAGFKYSIQ